MLPHPPCIPRAYWGVLGVLNVCLRNGSCSQQSGRLNDRACCVSPSVSSVTQPTSHWRGTRCVSRTVGRLCAWLCVVTCVTLQPGGRPAHSGDRKQCLARTGTGAAGDNATNHYSAQAPSAHDRHGMTDPNARSRIAPPDDGMTSSYRAAVGWPNVSDVRSARSGQTDPRCPFSDASE